MSALTSTWLPLWRDEMREGPRYGWEQKWKQNSAKVSILTPELLSRKRERPDPCCQAAQGKAVRRNVWSHTGMGEPGPLCDTLWWHAPIPKPAHVNRSHFKLERTPKISRQFRKVSKVKIGDHTRLAEQIKKRNSEKHRHSRKQKKNLSVCVYRCRHINVLVNMMLIAWGEVGLYWEAVCDLL